MGTDRNRLRWWSTNELVAYVARDLLDLACGDELTAARQRRFSIVARELRRRTDLEPGHNLRCVCEVCFDPLHQAIEDELAGLRGPFDDPVHD